MNLKQHRPPARRGKRWDAPLVTSNPATGPDFIQAEVHDSFRGKKHWRITRGRRWDAPLVAAVVPPTTVWPPGVIAAERRRGYRLARGKRWECVATDTFPEQRIARRANRAPFLRKGKRWDVIGVGVDALYGLWKPSATRGRVRVATPRRGHFLQLVSSAASLPAVSRPKRVVAALRRGRRFDTIPTAVAPIIAQVPLAITSSRRKWYRISRGRRFDVIPTATTFFPVINPIPWVIISSRRKWYSIRRGHRFDAPLVGATIIPTVWPPRTLPRRLRIIGLLQRKGKRWDPLKDQERPIEIKRTRRPLATTRRQRVLRVVPDQLRPITILRNGRRIASARRGRRWDAVRDQVIIIAPKYVPALIRSRRAQGMLRRGSRYGNLLVIRSRRVFDAIVTGRVEYGEGGHVDSDIHGSTEPNDLGIIDKSDGGEVL